jgi:hypothetical protein
MAVEIRIAVDIMSFPLPLATAVGGVLVVSLRGPGRIRGKQLHHRVRNVLFVLRERGALLPWEHRCVLHRMSRNPYIHPEFVDIISLHGGSAVDRIHVRGAVLFQVAEEERLAPHWLAGEPFAPVESGKYCASLSFGECVEVDKEGSDPQRRESLIRESNRGLVSYCLIWTGIDYEPVTQSREENRGVMCPYMVIHDGFEGGEPRPSRPPSAFPRRGGYQRTDPRCSERSEGVRSGWRRSPADLPPSSRFGA